MSKKAKKVQADSGCKGIQGNTSKAELKCVCLNARSIINKKNELDIMVDEIKPHIIGITESWANNDITDAELGLEGYVMFRKDRMGKRGGGVLLYIKENIPAYEVQLHEEADCNEAIWCKLVTGHTTVAIGVVYRCPNITKENNEKIHNAISEVSKGDCIIMGDFNHGNIKWDTLQSTGVEDQKFLCLVQDNFLTQHVLEPTRATRILDIVLSSQKELVDNVEIKEPLGSSDHNQMHFNINVKSDKTKVKQCRRDFRKGNYKEIRKRLTLIDWNGKMKNKTAAECWNIVRGELDNAIDSYVPMKKQGKRSKKKHLSKEAFRKIRYKQNMWRVYKHTGKDTDYDAYKEALNAATNEVRKSKRNFEHKLAQNIKSDIKSFYEERLKECGLTTLETRRLRGDQIEVFKILNGYENIDSNIFFEIKKSKITRGHNFTLVKKQSRLDVRKYSFSQRTINVWNKLSTDCVHATSVNVFKNRIDKYLVKAGYT